MRTVSNRFSEVVTGPHKLATRATLISTGEELPILSGSVTLNSNAEIRASADLQVADDGTMDWVPTSAESALAPFGEEIRLERGIEYQDGTAELVSVAIVRIEQVRVSDSGGELSIQVTGLDRAKAFVDAQFETPYQVASGTNAITAIEDVLTAANPEIETDFMTTTHTTPLLLAQEGENRWAFAQGIARWLGAELYHDGDGVAVITPVAQSTTSVLTIAEGEAGLLLEVDADWDREQAFNIAIVSGENAGETGAIPRGEARDEESDSPTRWDGPFGPKPIFFASEFVTSDGQADDAAAALLAKNLGVAKTVGFGSIVHPALEPLDAITVTRERAGISAEVLTVDSLSIPMGPEGQMSGTTRAIRVTS